MTQTAVVLEPVKRLSPAQIEARLRVCNPLPSLHRTNQSLASLLTVEQRYTTQISDIIRNDPSLSVRILQLVNSVYFGLAGAVKTVEEAVLYIGVEQIRQLALITPVIDDFKVLVSDTRFRWSGFWQHCIGTALLTREILFRGGGADSETDYLAGLLHDVGKIAMAAVFPEHFADVQHCVQGIVQDLLQVDRFVLGVDHCALGAAYLRTHTVPEVFVEVATYHHEPPETGNHPREVAAVYLANRLIRHAQIGYSGDPEEIDVDALWRSEAWQTIFSDNISESRQRIKSLTTYLQRLPRMLEAMM